MLIDTHCHLNIIVKSNFDSPLEDHHYQEAQDVVNKSFAQGVTRLINVGTSLIESLNCIDLTRIPGCYAAVGIHPNDCTSTWRDDLDKLTDFLKEKEKNKIVAIGECGMDKHYPDYDLERQKDAFRAQIELALHHDLALIIHSRDAREETLEVLHEYHREPLRGSLHCFSEDQDFADQVIKLGFVLGIGGTVTYPKNNMLREVVQTVGLEHIVLETDAPYLSPQPFRGKPNQPAYIKTIAEYLANLLATSEENVARVTTHNAEKIFKLLNRTD